MIRRRMAVLERSSDMTTLYAVMIACVVASIVGVTFSGGGAGWLLFGVPVFLFSWGLTSMARKRKRRPGEVEVVFDENGVQVENEPRIHIGRIVHGRFVPSPRNPRLRLVGAANTTVFEARVEDEAEANDLLRAIGRDPLHARARFEAATPKFFRTRSRGAVAYLAIICAFGVGLSVLGSAAFLGTAFAALTAFFLAATFAPSTDVEVGIDGVSISWLWQKRFVPFEEIADVKIVGDDAVLILRNAEYVPIGFVSKNQEEDDDERGAFVNRLKSAMAGRIANRDASMVLARGKRSLAEWAEAVSTARGGTYRDAGIRDEDLSLVLADPQSPPDVRFAAAWLLARDTEKGAAKVRVAIDAIAEPGVRVALERATTIESFEEAWGDDEEATEERARGSS